jgi:hypothetical protein
MRTGMILAVVAACVVASGCSKRSSLYLVPGRPADAPRPASHKPPPPSPSVQKASDPKSLQS